MTLVASPLGTCKVCKRGFQKFRSTQVVCGSHCANRSAIKFRKEREEKEAAERRQDRARKEALKKVGEWRSEAQAVFNRFIRLRDRIAGHGCICCGAPLDWNSTTPGGSVDAGHFVSRGAAIELAFDERNVNAQRKSCNRPGGTTRAKFTAGMTERYGATVVAELEGPHDLPKLKHDDLRHIRDTYRAKARELKKQLEAAAQAMTTHPAPARVTGPTP